MPIELDDVKCGIRFLKFALVNLSNTGVIAVFLIRYDADKFAEQCNAEITGSALLRSPS